MMAEGMATSIPSFLTKENDKGVGFRGEDTGE